nr:protein NYNRIN-like [Misgurnus anguillicaudatus]
MMDYIELTPAEGKRYCLVMTDMFLKWTEATPTKHADSAGVTKMLLKDIIPRWGIPNKISSDNGAHFTAQVVKDVGKFLQINLTNHCAYHPQSGGAVEKENGTIKAKLSKMCEETKLNWVQCLPLVLMYMRMRVRDRTKLSPFEILFGRPPHKEWEPHTATGDTLRNENYMLQYCISMSSILQNISKQVKAALPRPAEGPLHNIKPGDFVLVKNLRSKSWKARRWEGPFQVLLTTHTAVKVAERATWVHSAHCRRVGPGLQVTKGRTTSRLLWTTFPHWREPQTPVSCKFVRRTIRENCNSSQGVGGRLQYSGFGLDTRTQHFLCGKGARRMHLNNCNYITIFETPH